MKAQPPVNADLTLRRKLNQKLKPTKKTKKTDKTTSSAQNEKKKKGGQKTQTKKLNKKKPKKPRKVHVHDEEGEEESAGDCHDEEVSSDDDTKEKKKDNTKKKTPPEKRNNQFSLAQAQKLSKKGKKLPSSSSSNIKTEAKNPAPKVRARGKTSPKTEKTKQDPPAASSSRLKEGKEENAAGEEMESRVKQRHRITSRAYHQTLDSLKPKIKDGFTKGTKKWDEAMEHAKSKAREAGREAGKSFDLENPKEKKDKKNAPNETEEAEDDGIPDVS